MSRRHVITVGCVLTITALAPTTAPTAATRPALEAPAAPGAEAADSALPVWKPPLGMLNAMQRDLGLTEAQAQSRMLNEIRLIPIAASLRRRLSDRFAGAWLRGSIAQTLVVATTSPADTAQITALGARAKIVGRSLAELQEVKEKLDDALPDLSKVSRVRYIEVRTNKVVVLSDAPKATANSIEAARVATAAVQVTASTERPRLLRTGLPTDLVGGQAYYVGGTTRCSVGFPVLKGAQKGFISAGHCGKPGSATVGFNRLAQGVVQASTFPGGDYSWVEVNNNWTPRPLVNNDTGGTMRVYGSRQAIEGSSICLAGSSSISLNWHCGTIQQHDVSVTYPQGTVDHLTRTNACGNPGDSGGSLLSVDQAQGIASGGSGDCTAGGIVYFQPIHEILTVYDLILVTNDVSPLASTTSCSGFPGTANGRLGLAQFAYQPDNRYYRTTVTGDHYGCLESIDGGDFDLYLQKRIGSGWITVASSDSPNPLEELSYRGTPGDYRYLVLASSGSGLYQLDYKRP